MNDVSNPYLYEQQNRMIELISQGSPLQHVLQTLLNSLEFQWKEYHMSGVALLVDPNSGTFSHFIPRSLLFDLGTIYKVCTKQLKSETPQDTVFLKTFTGNGTHGFWSRFSHSARKLGFPTAWSIPVRNRENSLVGVILCFFKGRVPASDFNLELLTNYSRIASIAVHQLELSPITKQADSEPGQLTEQDLRRAFENEQFLLYYQPYFQPKKGAMGVEALLRLHHAERGILPPAAFLEVAEASGLMLDLEYWVLERAMKEVGQLQYRGKGMALSVNISAMQLDHPEFPRIIQELMEATEFPSGLLTLEITERFEIKDRHIQQMEELRRLGIRLSIDDFGTYYSSLHYLVELPIDELKIDRSLIQKSEYQFGYKKLVEKLVKLGHILQIEVVAEGVETEKQRRWLQRLKCDKLQGYLFSKPVPLETISELYGYKLVRSSF